MNSLLSKILLFAVFSLPCFGQSTTDPIQIETTLADQVLDEKQTNQIHFKNDTPIIYVFWKSKGLKEGEKIRSEWIADDTNQVVPPNFKIDQAELILTPDMNEKQLSGLPGSVWSGRFTLTKPTNGWPAGKYHVDIYVNNRFIKAVPFNINEVAP